MSAEPFTAFAFAVELRLPGSDAPLCEAAFCECDGLELRREIIRARDGADPASVRLLPGAESFGNVILRRGMTSSFDLWDWWERVRRGQAARATCDIVVLSPDLAQERVRFRLYDCLPAKITGPALNAAANDIAIESLELAFDVDASGPRGRRAPDDVRRLTERVAYFATPRAVRGAATTRPAVRLAWGTFQFDGHVEALEETLEAFSPDGRPLRATLALSLARERIAPYAFAAR